MQNELKTCPFCSSKATTHFLNEAWIVECSNSKCIGAKISCGYRREEDAVKAWNNRAREEGFNLAIKRIEELKK